MSTHPQLQDLLEQAAEAVPPAEVPRDTWQRGRRRHRRALALRAAAVVGVVALVAATPGLLDRAIDRTAPQPAGEGASALGLPDSLHPVPERMSERDDDGAWLRDEVTSDLAVGPAAAAWVTQAGLPVLVDAADGDYHLLDPPGFLLTSGLTSGWFPGDAAPLTLSPDGTRLAYAYAWPATDDGTAVPSGLRVVDLQTGEVERDLPLEGGAGVTITQVSWSPGGSWLAWSGVENSYWTTSARTGRRAVSGTVAPGGAQRRLEPAGSSSFVDDDGTAAVLTSGTVKVHRPDGSRTERLTTGVLETTDAGALAPDGDRLAIGTSAVEDLVVLQLDRSASYSRSGEAPDGRSWAVRPLGWVGDAVLVQRVPADGGPGRLTLAPVDADADLLDVGMIGGGDGSSTGPGVGPLSVATDLVTAERPTVSRPAPDWPWSEERWLLTVGLGILGLLVVGGLAWVVVRRRRRAREDVAEE
ncbi:hypothetical protein JOE61_001736 [Nocardioides salarius]|uniref:WD40 repeat domain-containing protein n=1 Tax=Nocardioides salarius TaxID=374513 RepID=A0ABS2M9Q4_9ACTN|nr:hypothetical protein [Nocardioides salarius]MBM7507922.1 hypothetical protein [Nocardioides salarius]